MSWLVILLSILLGLIPESLFFSIFIIGAKKIKERRACFCILSIGIFVLLGMLLAYNLWLYVILTVALYALMKLLYKDTEFIDLFLLTIPYLIIAFAGYFCYGIASYIPPEYNPNTISLILNRFFIFIILSALYPHLNKWYNSYKKIWNVHADNKIKSITVRNISILICNAMIMAAYYMLLIRK